MRNNPLMRTPVSLSHRHRFPVEIIRHSVKLTILVNVKKIFVKKELFKMRLKDRVTLITGASSGIGKAIATRFAVEGAHVVVNYRPGSELDGDAAQAEAASFGPSSIAVVADVSQREDVERMMAEIIKQFGRIDIAINNAGIEI